MLSQTNLRTSGMVYNYDTGDLELEGQPVDDCVMDGILHAYIDKHWEPYFRVVLVLVVSDDYAIAGLDTRNKTGFPGVSRAKAGRLVVQQQKRPAVTFGTNVPVKQAFACYVYSLVPPAPPTGTPWVRGAPLHLRRRTVQDTRAVVDELLQQAVNIGLPRNEFLGVFNVPGNPYSGKRIVCPLEKLEIIKYARSNISTEAIKHNPRFANLPFQITYPELRSIIDSKRAWVRQDDQIQAGFYTHLPRRTVIALYNSFAALADWIHAPDSLSPMRREILHWYISERLARRSAPALAEIMALNNAQYFTLAKLYAQACISDAKRTRIRESILTRLNEEQRYQLEKLIELRVLRYEFCLRDAFTTDDENLFHDVQQYVSYEARQRRRKELVK